MSNQDKQKAEEEPIDKALVEQKRKMFEARAESLRFASRFLSDLRGDHSRSAQALDIGARLNDVFASELAEILGEIPF